MKSIIGIWAHLFLVFFLTAQNPKKNEVLATFDDGVVVHGRQVSEEETAQINFSKPGAIGYYAIDGMVFRIFGRLIYIDEAMFFEQHALIVVSPIHRQTPMLALEPADFIELYWHSYAFAADTSSEAYFSIISEEYGITEIPEIRAIDPHQCDSNTHNAEEPHHVETEDAAVVCHGTVGSDGSCYGSTGELIYYMSCEKRMSADGQTDRSFCRAIIECANGRFGTYGGGPASASEISCGTRVSNGSAIFIGQTEFDSDKGYITCGGKPIEFDCSK